MILISLPNGKTIGVPIDVYLRMDDDDYNYLISINAGDEINDPFYHSVLEDGEEKDNEVIELEEIEDPDTDIDIDPETE